jgi:hypothetical protein
MGRVSVELTRLSTQGPGTERHDQIAASAELLGEWRLRRDQSSSSLDALTLAADKCSLSAATVEVDQVRAMHHHQRLGLLDKEYVVVQLSARN